MDEITAEYEASSFLETPTLRVRPRVSFAARTDLGRVRENNEDKFEFFLPDGERELASRGSIFLVCDGMGGHAAGQIASELAAKTFVDVYRNHPGDDPLAAARAAVLAAHRFVADTARAVPARRGMGTTLSALLLVQDQAVVAHVGDSRIYRLRDGSLERLTTDHTWVEAALRSGAISEEEAAVHPYRHALAQAIGTESTVQPDLARHDLREGDRFLLCSDGLTTHVPDGAIEEALRDLGPAEAAWALVGQALADGGTDNVTVMVIRVDALERLEGDPF